MLKHLIQKGDWMIKIDLKDAYFTVPIDLPHQPLFRFIDGGTRYQFTCLPFGLGPAPPSVHQAFKACCSPSKETGSENDYLFRRYNYIQSDSGWYFEGQGLHPLAASELRLCNKLEKISFTSSPVHGIPRLCDQFFGDETISARGEIDQPYTDLQRFNSGEESLSENSLSDNWETDLIYTGSFSSTPPLSAFAKAPSKGFVDGQGVGICSPSE